MKALGINLQTEIPAMRQGGCLLGTRLMTTPAMAGFLQAKWAAMMPHLPWISDLTILKLT
jgi:hypothetical protein